MLTTEMDAIRHADAGGGKGCAGCGCAQGYACDFEVVWDTINLQDEVEDAKAQLYLEQARQLGLPMTRRSSMREVQKPATWRHCVRSRRQIWHRSTRWPKGNDTEEVYTFSVRLCDNEIDRDGERFDEQTLRELAALFIGKSGIFDHCWSAWADGAHLPRGGMPRGRAHHGGFAFGVRG